VVAAESKFRVISAANRLWGPHPNPPNETSGPVGPFFILET
jgi:hypothetical protein